MFNVCILMSTYNPTIYIVDQIKSILNQRDCHIDIYIRDDGSTDVSYLKEISMYCKKIYYEDNLGVSKSIHNLVNKIIDLDEIYDFYAFADQDDVWLEEKLRKAIYCIKDFNQAHPALYYSNLRVVNTNLEGNRNLFKSGIVKTTKEQALAQIFTFGCTCVFNRKCLLVFGLTNIGDLPFDNVILIESVFLGKTYYDEIPYILYRQHGENVSGQKEFGIKKIVARFNQLPTLNDSNSIFHDLSEFILKNFFDNLSREDIVILKRVINYKNSIKDKVLLIFDKRIRAGYMPKDLYRWIRIIMNKY